MKSVSLYSGCGGLDAGLARAGFETVVAIDSSEQCAASYSVNFPDTPFVRGELPAALDQVVELARAHEIDLLAGGPPCPPYSKSRFYRKDKPRALKDEVGDKTLEGYLGALRAIRPRAFILENVAGFAYKVHREALEILLATADELGYRCTWQVLNAADYGVPQLRERCFVVGMLEGEFRFPDPTHTKPVDEPRFARLPLWRTAGDVLKDLDTPENADDEGHVAGGKHRELLKQVPPGDNYLYFTEKRGHPDPLFEWRSRYWSFLLKLSPDMPSWTIQARRSNNMGPFHWRNRILRISEIKRLQTFPDDWVLDGTVEQQWRQIGNAVPVALAEQLGIALEQELATPSSLPLAA